MNKIHFDLQSIAEFRGIVADLLDENLLEHDEQTLAAMKEVYPSDKQDTLKVIERNLLDSRSNRPRLHQELLASALAVIKMSQAKSVLDIGCGEGMLVRALTRESYVEKIIGNELDELTLLAAKTIIEQEVPALNQKVTLSSDHLDVTNIILSEHIEAVVLIEVVEHISDKDWITQILSAKPQLVIVTTPNISFNALYPKEKILENGFRHPDHKFEFTQDEFIEWSTSHAQTYGYSVSLLPVGPADLRHGSSGQMAIFQLS